jgi:hypothetical protein
MTMQLLLQRYVPCNLLGTIGRNYHYALGTSRLLYAPPLAAFSAITALN